MQTEIERLVKQLRKLQVQQNTIKGTTQFFILTDRRRIDANGDRSTCEASESTSSPTIDHSWEVKRTRGERFLGRRGQRGQPQPRA